MKSLRVFILASLVSSCGSDIGTIKGYQCLVKLAGADHTCYHFTGADYLASDSEAICDSVISSGSSYTSSLVTTCPTEGSFGTCTRKGGTADESSYRVYSGSATSQQSSCESASGVWTAD